MVLFDHIHWQIPGRSTDSYGRARGVSDRCIPALQENQYEVYNGVILAERYKAITKKARKINHSERFNNTLHQCISRLVRAPPCTAGWTLPIYSLI